LFDAAIMRRVEPVVHARCDPQRGVGAIAELHRQRSVAEELLERVWEALCLESARALDATARAYDAVARAGDDRGVAVDRARAFPELPGKTVVHAREPVFPCLLEAKIRERAPYPKRHIPDERLLDLAEPAHEPRQKKTRDPVGEQELQLLGHGAVTSRG
jgi:hypothetical protein